MYPPVQGKEPWSRSCTPTPQKKKILPCKSLSIPFSQSERLPPANPDQHYQMSHEMCHHHNISRMLGDNYGDPACNVSSITFHKTIHSLLTALFQNFIPNLKDYTLCKIFDLEYDLNEIMLTEAQQASINFVKNKIYLHKVLCVNYTTYDLRREQYSLNPHTHANIMVLSQEDNPSAHPYWYAHIIGIYHTLVCHKSSPDPILIDFLWIRWYGLDLDRSSCFGWKLCRLPKVGFIPDSPDAGSLAFGFLDPAQVVQGVHLIPCFSKGSTSDLLKPSLTWLPHEGDLDWRCYYVNMYVLEFSASMLLMFTFSFVDRDMVMHFRGGGVGHTSTRAATNKFLQDHDHLDLDDGLKLQGDNDEYECSIDEEVGGDSSGSGGDGNGDLRDSKEEEGENAGVQCHSVDEDNGDGSREILWVAKWRVEMEKLRMTKRILEVLMRKRTMGMGISLMMRM